MSPRCAASPQCTALSAPLTISEEVVLHSMELGERLRAPQLVKTKSIAAVLGVRLLTALQVLQVPLLTYEHLSTG